MMVYIGNTGHIQNHQNLKILFWSPESEKRIFTIFPEIFTRKFRDTGISSETTIPGPLGRLGPASSFHDDDDDDDGGDTDDDNNDEAT